MNQLKSYYFRFLKCFTGNCDGQNRIARKSLFKGRIFLCPGNHDFGAAGNFYSRERAERFDEFLSIPLGQGGTFTGDKTPVVNIVQEDGEKVMVIALDTNLETEQAFDFACGKVGKTQRSALDNILCNPTTRDMKKIVSFIITLSCTTIPSWN